MRILSYNIRLALDSSLDRIAAVLRALEPDVVCLQEVGNHWRMGPRLDMRAALGRLAELPFGVFAPALQDGDAQYGIAVLSRYPLVVLERRPLPRERDEPRVLLGCRVEDPDGAWLLVTSHVSVEPLDRPAQFDHLTRWALTLRGRHPLPLILAGDLNAELDEPALRAALGWMKLRAAHAVALDHAPKTYPTSAPRLAIDHVLVSREWRVVGAAVPTLEGSDHLPIFADLDRPAT